VRTEEEEERPRSEDGGFTSGPEDGVPSSDGVVGSGLPAQQQAGRIWPCIRRDVRRARPRVKASAGWRRSGFGADETDSYH
jgi:hypothetical protein